MSTTSATPTPTTPVIAPRSLQEAGLRLDLVVHLLLKTLHLTGELSGVELADRLGVTFPVIAPAIEPLKAQHLVEIVGGTQLGAPSYRYRITQLGRERAAVILSTNMYTGAAPVPLDQYRAYMKSFAGSVLRDVSRAAVRQALGHLVLSDRVLDQLGPAISGGHSLFVYGPPGNGKTVVSQSIGNLLHGELWVPQAIEIDGSIVQVFDPMNHEPLSEPPAKESLDDANRTDRRWVRCKRPMVTVGGELTLDALELGYNDTAGFYRAPLQLIANGGVLVIDDFGRQRCSPHALLNRWILPLESRVDYLTLRNGQKVEVPFKVLPVFATNIKPIELVDEAFLRRIHYKVFAESPTPRQFLQIFSNCVAERNLEVEPGLAEALLTEIYPARKVQIRGCQPRDLIEQSLSIARYLGEPLRLTRRLMEAACDAYFVDAEQGVESVRSTAPGVW